MEKNLEKALQEMNGVFERTKIIEFELNEKKYSKGQAVSAGVVSKGPAAGTQQKIAGGGVAAGGAVPSDALQHVRKGGIAAGMAVKAGGVQLVGAGGMAAGARIASGGLQCVAGGDAAGTHLNAGAVQLVSGGAAFGAVVSAGACQQVVSGSAAGTRIASGGTQFIGSEYGTAFSSVVSAGGLQIVEGSAVNAEVYGTQMLRKGYASGVAVHKGGRQIADRQSIVESVRIDRGAAQLLYDAHVSGAAVFGRQTAENSEICRTDVEAGGRQTLETCSVSGGTVKAGGVQIVRNVVGSLRGVVVASGGVQQISATSGHGYVDSAVIEAGGVQKIATGACGVDVCSTTLAGRQTIQTPDGLIADTKILSTKILSGGQQKIVGAKEVCNTFIEAGGRQEVSGCSQVMQAAISSGGMLKALNCSMMHSIEVSAGGSAYFASCQDVELQTAGTAVFMQGGNTRSVEVLSQGTAKLLSGTVTNVAVVRNGGTLKLASGAEVHGIFLPKGGVLSGGGMILKGSGEIMEPAYVPARAYTAFDANIRMDSSGLTFKEPGTKLAYMKTDKNASVNFSLEHAAPASKCLLTIDASKAHLGGSSFAVVMLKRSPAGTYRIEKGLAMPSGAQWTISAGGGDAVKTAVNGSAASIHGKACRLVSSGGAVSLQISLQAGKMLRGAAKGGTLAGTKSCDVFHGGAGNDAIKAVDGADVAVYGAEKWGRDVVEATNGAMTLLFAGLKSSDVAFSRFGSDMVFTRKADRSQTVTVRKWDDASHAVVFGTGTELLNKWCAGTSLTAAQLKTAQTDAWKAAKLA